jgi:DNA ligase-associated metallophosphoesterase
MRVEVAGTELELLPERAAYWHQRGTLFLADTHWGKAATLRAHSIPIPMGATADDLERLTRAVEKTQCRGIVLLGDAIHAREGQEERTLRALAEWRESHRLLDFVLVRGNHDRGAGDPPAELRIQCVNAPVVEGPFAFLHHPRPTKLGYVLAGHTHPAVKLRGQGRQRATLPCFWVTKDVMTLPAFGSFCGKAVVKPGASDRVYVIAEEEVLQVETGAVSAESPRPPQCSEPPRAYRPRARSPRR